MKSAISLTILFFLITPVVIFAQTKSATTSSTRKEKIETRLEEKKDRIEARKETIQTRLDEKKERIATRAATLKTKLDKFKNQKKAKVAERINTNLNKINDSKTAAMLRHLEKMTEILTKLETRVNESVITDAKKAIEIAKNAVEIQSANDYTITATSEAKIKDDASLARNKLHTDLKAVSDLVILARKAVANAISTAKSNLGGNK